MLTGLLGRRLLLAATAGAVALTTATCTSSPAQPSSTAGQSGASSIGAPVPLQPANGAILATAVPITLVAQNATVTGTGAVTYTFEVATDPGFANKVQTDSSVPQGANGQTSDVIAPLANARDYYWHVRANASNTTGVFSAVNKFTTGALSPPTPIAPATGAVINGLPTLTVTDSVRTATAGPVAYRFDVASSAAFTIIVISGTVAETPGQTSFTPPPQPLPPYATLYWRATAIDTGNGASSAASATLTYTSNLTMQANLAAQEGTQIWPGAQPGGGPNGHAVLGNGWGVGQLVSFNGQVFLSPQIDQLRVFDLLDRGYDPQSAITWMNTNGYGTIAAWYPGPAVIGFSYQYMAYIDGAWNLVLKVGA
jgi:hypothetical protein